MSLPSKDQLREVLDYDQITGIFTWKVQTGRRAKIGDRAGYKDVRGYIIIGVLGVHQPAHRLAFLYMTGQIQKMIDHIDGVGSNNAWSNLREAEHCQNAWNTKIRNDNTSGYKGVHWNAQRGMWRSVIKCRGKRYDLGHFDDPAEAHLVYMQAAKNLFGQYARAQ